MNIVCLDLEGVLVPEVWIHLAGLTGIDAFRRTTRDVSDYDELMRMRLEEMRRHGLGLADVQDAVSRIEPLPGARAFLDGLRRNYQVVILSDTFYEFARPLMAQLNWPTLFCHSLEVDGDGRIVAHRIRLQDHKKRTVESLRDLNFRTVAAGDSYNDTGMLGVAHAGFLFDPPAGVVDDFPHFPVARGYEELRTAIDDAFAR